MKKIVSVLLLTLLLAGTIAACAEVPAPEPVQAPHELHGAMPGPEEAEAPAQAPQISVEGAAPAPGVRVISDGNEHEAFRHWNHGFSSKMRASGWFKRAGEVADALTPFLFSDDFQIIIEGELWRSEFYYYFYKLTDGEWLKVLAVYSRPEGQEVYLTHGETWDSEYWEAVVTQDFWELLQAGEYILDLGGWWGDSESADSYNNFFRFIK